MAASSPPPSPPDTSRVDWLIGLGVYGCAVVGTAGVASALFAFAGGRWSDVGVCLAASAIAFGLLANALLRK
jgi:hypothetical protein